MVKKCTLFLAKTWIQRLIPLSCLYAKYEATAQTAAPCLCAKLIYQLLAVALLQIKGIVRHFGK